ncbi:MAG: hypothetical protein M1834_007658 [Cirrosporium novae-zelandiae]|nr:MAG: hypothetical protein M1834_007658 [Cirrosporium novae-zelandiae]
MPLTTQIFLSDTHIAANVFTLLSSVLQYIETETVYFLTGTNNHIDFVIGGAQFTSMSICLGIAPSTTYRVFLTDITAKPFDRTANTTSGVSQAPVDSFDISLGEFRTHSIAEELLPSITSISTLPDASFNLTSVPKGLNLYGGGSGTFF